MGEKMTLDQLMSRILAILPDAEFDDENSEEGEVRIYTGVRVGKDDFLESTPAVKADRGYEDEDEDDD